MTSDKDQNDEVDGNLRSHQKRTVSPLWSEASIHQLSVERRQPPHFDAAVELLGLESYSWTELGENLRRTEDCDGRSSMEEQCVHKNVLARNNNSFIK